MCRDVLLLVSEPEVFSSKTGKSFNLFAKSAEMDAALYDYTLWIKYRAHKTPRNLGASPTHFSSLILSTPAIRPPYDEAKS